LLRKTRLPGTAQKSPDHGSGRSKGQDV